MRWIRSLSKAGVLALISAIVLLISQSTAAEANKAEWPEGWSKPILLTEADSYQYGFQAAAAGDDTLWLVTVVEEELTIFKCSLEGDSIEVAARQPFTGRLIDYAVAVHEGRLYLVWADGEGSSALWYKSFELDGSGSAAVKVWETERYIDSVAAAAGREEHLIVAWSALDIGADNYSIYLREVNTDSGGVGELLVVSDPDRYLDSQPRLAMGADGTVHLVYLQQEHQSAEIIYRTYSCSRELSKPVKFITSAGTIKYLPVLLPRADGTADVVWRQSILVRGALRNMGVAYARISTETEVPQFRPIGQSRHYVTAVNGAVAPDGSILAVWAVEDESMQLAYAELSQSGQITRKGMVTADAGHHFDPQPLWVGGHRAVVYYQQHDDGSIGIYLVNDVNPAEYTLALRLGLDEGNPVADFLFQFVNTALSAAVLALLSFPAITLGVVLAWILNRTGLFSETRLGGLALQVACLVGIALIKRTDSLLYYGAQFLPGAAGALTALFSAIFALVAVVLFKLERNDLLSVLLSCYLFIFVDNLCALMAKGLGIW